MIVAPDKFKGTLTAREAANAIASGVGRVLPSADIVRLPLADGGEGTADALVSALGGESVFATVPGPLGEIVRAPLWRLSNGDIVVEMASASGLHLVPEGRRDPLAASSEGAGGLIAKAWNLSPRRLVVGVGGSASTDGGTGAARAIGWRFLDREGRDLPRGGGALTDLATIEGPDELPSGVVGACDVSSPLCGPAGAARVFGPQKGATPAQVELLERGLERLREVVAAQLGVEIDGVPGAGAGGGMGAGLKSFFRAELRSGFDLVAGAVGLRRALDGASLVITGEGRIDDATLADKVPAGVARLARDAGVPCLAVAGELALDAERLGNAGFAGAIGCTSAIGSRALLDPVGAVTEATAMLLVAHGHPPPAGRY